MSFCEYQNEDVCNPPNTTEGHEECWVGMTDADDFGQLDGQDCGNGCAHCPDFPFEVQSQGIAHTSWESSSDWVSLQLHTGLTGGWRFLAPLMDGVQQPVTAKNTWSDLRSGQPLLCRPGALLTLGCCYDGNQGRECTGQDLDMCSCWKGNPTVIGGSPPFVCPDGTPYGHPTGGFYGNAFFYTGWGWPTLVQFSNLGFSIHPGQNTTSYCRKFTPFHPCPQTVAGIPLVLGSAESLMPVFYRQDQGCAFNWLAPFMAGAAAPSPGGCLNGYASADGDENNNVGAPYLDAPCTLVVKDVRPVSDPDNPVGFPVDSPNFPLTDIRTNEIRNLVMSKVFSETFPHSEFPNGITFDQLTQEVFDTTAPVADNTGISHFRRHYDGTGENPEDLIEVVRLPHCRTRFGDCQIDASLVITRVSFTAWIVLGHTARDPVGAFSLDDLGGDQYATPFASIHIKVTCGIRINSIDGTKQIVRAWLEDDDPNKITPVDIIESENLDEWPIATPERNRIIYAELEGELDADVESCRIVEWRGQLGFTSKPTAQSQRANLSNPEPEGGSSNEAFAAVIAQRTDGFEVPALPSLLDSAPENPNQLWSGSLRFYWSGTAGYDSCIGILGP